MSSPSAVKRKRLNNASARLTKPFVSPLRTKKPEQCAPGQANEKVETGSYTPSVFAHSRLGPQRPRDVAAIKQATPVHQPEIAPARTYQHRVPQSAFARSGAKRTEPAELAVARAITQIELQIKRVRNDIDILTQSQSILSSTRDTELEELALKWKKAAQDAAEELFGAVKERVCRMGGVQAWRESEKRKYERSNGLGDFAPDSEELQDDDRDCEFDSQGEELPEEEQEYRKAEKRRVREEQRDAMDGFRDQEQQQEVKTAKVWQEPGQDDDSFTMDMMLRSLNIELDIVGYDKHAQRWTT